MIELTRETGKGKKTPYYGYILFEPGAGLFLGGVGLVLVVFFDILGL